MLESGWPIHHVQEMLGHSSLEQTSTYLNVERVGLRASMRKSDDARTGCNPVAIEAGSDHPTDSKGDGETRNEATVNYRDTVAFAPVAQRIEHPPPKRGAAGSIPAGRAIRLA